MRKADPALHLSVSQQSISHSKDPAAFLQVGSVSFLHPALGMQYFLNDSRRDVFK